MGRNCAKWWHQNSTILPGETVCDLGVSVRIERQGRTSEKWPHRSSAPKLRFGLLWPYKIRDYVNVITLAEDTSHESHSICAILGSMAAQAALSTMQLARNFLNGKWFPMSSKIISSNLSFQWTIILLFHDAISEKDEQYIKTWKYTAWHYFSFEHWAGTASSKIENTNSVIL